jgi:hypothetical protein
MLPFCFKEKLTKAALSTFHTSITSSTAKIDPSINPAKLQKVTITQGSTACQATVTQEQCKPGFYGT